ncbi:MAG: hypothetical protein KTR31_31630 [Myxococcales bacterium]|nr:hypothetical protein [Myxococcales bacterium]
MFAEWLLLWAGCGSVVDGAYLGEPLFRIEGNVFEDELDASTAEVSVAIVWPRAATAEARSQPVLVQTSFPARYTLDVFNPPDPSTLQPLSGATGVEASVGDIVLFDDLDEDDRWGSGEPILGGAFEAALVWVDPDTPPSDLQPFDLQPGYNLAQRDPFLDCDAPLTQQLGPTTEPATDLHVGYYWPILRSLECTGDGGAYEDFRDLLWQECPPPFVLEVECETYAELLKNPYTAASLMGMLDGDDFYSECLATVCPEVVAMLRR